MQDCNAILREGIFNTIYINTQRSFSQELFTWLRQSDYSTVRNEIDAGLDLTAIFGVNFTEEEFEEWKSEFESGTSSNTFEEMAMQVLASNVDPGILDAWTDCLRLLNQNRFGLICNRDGDDDDDTFVFTYRWVPNSMTDYPPRITSFVIEGGTSSGTIQVGIEVPLTGIGVLVQRSGRGEMAVLLNTERGTCSDIIPRKAARINDFNVQVIQEPTRARIRLTGPQEDYVDVATVDYRVTITGEMVGAGLMMVPIAYRQQYSSSNRNSRFEVEQPTYPNTPSASVQTSVARVEATITMTNGRQGTRNWP